VRSSLGDGDYRDVGGIGGRRFDFLLVWIRREEEGGGDPVFLLPSSKQPCFRMYAGALSGRSFLIPWKDRVGYGGLQVEPAYESFVERGGEERSACIFTW
jgi:hypothetical protein